MFSTSLIVLAATGHILAMGGSPKRKSQGASVTAWSHLSTSGFKGLRSVGLLLCEK